MFFRILTTWYKILAQYVHFYLGFYASQNNNFSADVYVHLAVNGLTAGVGRIRPGKQGRE
jgi:hypothetical protein